MNNAIEFKQINKCFPKSKLNALNNISLSITEGDIVTILGTSGCGKTTLLKMVNRLVEPTGGDILLFGKSIYDLDAVELRRQIGYVIQDTGLFPHMTIAQNIATVPSILKWDKKRIANRVTELLELIDLDPAIYRKRFPHQLSGGQQQRVGLARALAANPSLMLLDEPFGAIDAITRRNLQEELLRIHSLNKKTFLFVTHDIHEAFRLGNKVLILDQGSVMQYDTPKQIINSPTNDFVEQLIQQAFLQQEEWSHQL